MMGLIDALNRAYIEEPRPWWKVPSAGALPRAVVAVVAAVRVFRAHDR